MLCRGKSLEVDVQKERIIGFVSLAVHSIKKGFLAKETTSSLPSNIPVMKIEYLAVDKKSQGNGYGQVLMARAFQASVIVSATAGMKGVVLWAHESVVEFYRSLGMVELIEKQFYGNKLTLMFISVDVLAQASVENIA